NNELLAKQMKKLRVSNNSSNNASNNATTPSISRASKINNSRQTLSNAKDNKNDITDITMTESSTMATKNSSLKNSNTPPKTNANSNKLKKTGKSVKFSLPDESQSIERSKAFNEKVKEERRKLKMNKELQLQQVMSALNVNEWKGSLVKADPIQNIATVIVKPFPGRFQRLKLSKRPRVPYILYEKTFPCNIMSNIIIDNETIQNVPLNWNVGTFIYIYNCHDILKIFKNPGIKYMDFSPDSNDCFEVKDMRNIIQHLGAILYEDYNDEIELIHYLFGKQVLFIPNLINLKRLPNCKFFGYGIDPKSQNSFTLEEYFPQGGYVTATTSVLINEQDAIDRILAIMNYQSYKHNGAKWEL
ncbi:11739_t:CDS:2, partial [Dentiscutata erythropus]